MKSFLRTCLIAAAVVGGFCALAALAGAQDSPALPALPQLPAPPALPHLAIPSMAAIPAFPPMAEMTAAPTMPAMPAMPPLPPVPAFPGWSGQHSFSISDGHHQPATDCSDLHVRFSDRSAIMESEDRTITKAEAPTLRVRPHQNGGVQVTGWDKDTYSVTACKFASDEDGAAKRILAQMTLSVKGGEVSTNGPSGDGDWTAFLLIRAPKAAVIDLETVNGPLSLYTVDGKLTAHATNGPISLHDFTGDADVQATNGPISISGSSGNVRIHTENGPISINLKGTTWNGTGLTADAQNGPLTLSVPSDYKSSFSVESRYYSPMSCHASICDNARKTWDDNNRRIEFGASPAMIKLSTVNGPVSIQSSRGDI